MMFPGFNVCLFTGLVRQIEFRWNLLSNRTPQAFCEVYLEVHWHTQRRPARLRCVAYDALATWLFDHVQEGQRIGVMGRVRQRQHNRTYEWVTEFILDRVTGVCDAAPTESAAEEEDDPLEEEADEALWALAEAWEQR